MNKAPPSQPYLRHTFPIAGIFAFRMIGLFMILPVLSIHVSQGYLGPVSTTAVGLAIGVYGVSQALMQIPFGMMSDYWGRKKIIAGGLILFIIGSLLAGCADNITQIIIGRALQGAGAISSVLLALLADLTVPAKRARAMMVVGVSIGSAFMLSTLLGPLLYHFISLSGIFFTAAGLGLVSLFILLLLPAPLQDKGSTESSAAARHIKAVFLDRQLLRLDFGILALHASITGFFVTTPLVLHQLEVSIERHWQVYLTVLAASVPGTLVLIRAAEKSSYEIQILRLAIMCLACAALGLLLTQSELLLFCCFLIVYFSAFNALEAMLPPLVSSSVPVSSRGSALGVYSCSQFIGIFIGGLGAGWVYDWFQSDGVYLALTALAMLWLLATRGQRLPAGKNIVIDIPHSISDSKMKATVDSIPGVIEAVPVWQDSVLHLRVNADFNRKLMEKRLTEGASPQGISRSDMGTPE